MTLEGPTPLSRSRTKCPFRGHFIPFLLDVFVSFEAASSGEVRVKTSVVWTVENG